MKFSFFVVASLTINTACALELTILHFNDVYHLARGKSGGGLARASTLAKRLREENPNVLVTFGGDAFFPSLESLVVKGEQMVEAFNAMRIDIAVVGNHEFDDPDPKIPKRLFKESRFPWLAANIRDKKGQALPNTKDYVVFEKEGFKIAFFGVGVLFDNHLVNLNYEDPVAAADRVLEEINKENPDLIIGLTHINMPQDEEITRRHPEVDLILGGHEHDNRFGSLGKAMIIKSDSECRLVYVLKVKVTREQSDKVTKRITVKALPVTSDIAEDPQIVELAQKYRKKVTKALGPDERLAKAQTEIRAEENNTLVLHLKETSLCNMVVDSYRDMAKTDIALEMAGALKNEDTIGPGKITKYAIYSLLPQNDKLMKLSLKGSTLKLVLNRWVANEGNGGFPCVSGLVVTYDQSRPYGDKVLDVKINGGSLDQEATYTAALNSWAAASVQKLDPQIEILPLEKEMFLREVLEQWLGNEHVVAPQIEGRIIKKVVK